MRSAGPNPAHSFLLDKCIEWSSGGIRRMKIVSLYGEANLAKMAKAEVK
jgi:hypothetical protein